MNAHLMIVALAALLATDPPAEVKRDQHGDPLPPGAVGRLGTTRFRDEDKIVYADISPDKKLIATSTGKTLVVWEVETGRPIQVGMPPKPWIVRTEATRFGPVGFSPDGKSLALSFEPANRANQIHVYNVASGALRRSISGLGFGADQLAFSLDGRFIFGISDKRLLVWDANTGERINSLPGLPAQAHKIIRSPDRKTVALTVAGEDSKTLVWLIHDLSTGKPGKRFDRQQGSIGHVTYFPDGKTIAWIRNTGDWEAPKNSDALELQVLEADSGKVTKRAVPFHWTRKAVAGRRISGIRDICISPDGNRIAIGNGLGAYSDEASIILFDAATLAETARLQEPHYWQHVYGLRFLDNDRLLTWGTHHSLTLWDLKTGNRTLPKDGPETPPVEIVFGADDQTLIQVESRAKNAYRRWEIATNKVSELVRAEFPSNGSAQLSRNGRFLLSSADGKAVELVGLGNGERIGKWQVPEGLELRALSADGRLAAATKTVNSDEPITIYDAFTGQKQCQVSPQEHSTPTPVVFSPDNARVFFGGHNGIDIHDLKQARKICTIGGYPPAVAQPMDVDPLARTSQDDERIRKDAERSLREMRSQGYRVNVSKLFISSDGKRLVSLNQDSSDKCVRIWDVAGGRQCRVIPLDASHHWSGNPIALAPDNRMLALAKERDEHGGSIGLFDMYTGRAMHTFRGHLGPVNCLAFSHDGRFLASGGTDTTTLLWTLTAIPSKGGPPLKALTEKELTDCWILLSSSDATAAFDALTRLIDDPERSIPFAKKQMATGQPLANRLIEDLIANLDSGKFAIREAASADLKKLGSLAEPAMKKRLASAPSPEVAARLKLLLAALPAEKFEPAVVFASRLTEMLERIGTREAQELLTELAKGKASEPLSKEAAASLARLTAAPRKRQ